jgi:mannose-6-phosphate isomerase-like protein (cupin superfamily)
MKQLIDAIKVMFNSAADSSGELARNAGFALKNVIWTDDVRKHDPASNTVVASNLEAACTNAGQPGSVSHAVAEALLAESEQMKWRISTRNDDPDLATFSNNFTAVTILGAGGLLSSNKITAGFSLQGRNIFYPPHAHVAEESYWIIGGSGNWKIDDDPWFSVSSGNSIHHKSGAHHAMKTNDHPLLSMWLWTSHLDSEVKFIRGDF